LDELNKKCDAEENTEEIVGSKTGIVTIDGALDWALRGDI
jgi:hypothetical protein